MADPAQVLENALSLRQEDRARLIHKLIASLEQESDPDAQALWATELMRRSQAVENGTATLIDADEVHADIATQLRDIRSQ